MRLRDYDLFTRMIRTRPLFLAALLYLLGCIFAYVLDAAWFCACAALVILPMFALLIRKRRPRYFAALLILAMLPLGMLRFDLAWSSTEPFKDQTGAILAGRICETPEWNPETERVICVLEDLSVDGVPREGRLRLYLRGDTRLLQAVELGQRISCEAHIWRADEASNPGQFNFSNYLRVNGLRGYATAVIEDAQLSPPEIRFSDRIELLRGHIGERIDRLFPENTALARAFLLGDRSGLSDEERESYSRSGAAHLLAISGMHVSVLAAFVSHLLGRFMRRGTAFTLTLILLAAYGALIGFSSSLLRAVLMFSVFGLAPLVGRYSDGPTRLAAAMLVYLFIRPTAILETSFILSYGATAGIIFLNLPLQRLAHAEEYLRKRVGVGWIALLRNRLPRWIASSLIVTAAAQLAILPAIVHAFGAQPLWSFAVNLIAVPLAMCAYILSILATILNLSPLAALGDFLFGLLTKCVSFFAALPLSSLRIARFPLWLTILCVIVCLLSSDLSRIHRRVRSWMPLFMILAVFISNGCAAFTARGLSIVFLDAGQADCAVVRAEGRIYLMDTGDAYTPAADYLSAMNYDVDGIFLSHPHTDHAGGLADILEVCTPERIYISDLWHAAEIDESISAAMELAAGRGSEIITLSAGDEIALSDKTLLQVLSPSAGIEPLSANEDSMIVRIDYGNASAVFGGDAPASVASGRIGDADVLKVNHHGASDAVSAALLEELSPSVAVIPVGYNNYGHPAGETLELLRTAGARIFRTDVNGAITCRLNEDGSVAVRPYFTPEDPHGLE